jgi:hypothetical protein
MKRDSACFDESEAERREWSQGDTVLVEPGCESDRIREQQSKPADWILCRAAFCEDS